MKPMRLPDAFASMADDACGLARDVPGFTGEPELRALLMLAAVASESAGVIVEIGSFKGRSTVALASLARSLGRGPVVSIDPHTSPSITDPGMHSFADFSANLGRAGVTDQVEVHRARSQDAAREWNRAISLLWIDGDHTWAGARDDFELFSRWLAPGGIVAIHDALHYFEGPIRVFTDLILGDDRFGPAGFLHTIAWAQFRPDDGIRWRTERARLARGARRVLARVTPPQQDKGLNRLLYRMAAGRVEHAIPSPEQWLKDVGEPA